MAASKLKGLTIAINGDTTGLDAALSGVNKKSKNLQSELREVERLLKMDPSNTELLAQKQKLLADSVGNTKDKLKTLKTAAEQAQEQLERGEISEEQYRALQREVVKTEQSLSSLEKAAEKSNTAMSKISATADKVAKSADKVASATRGLSTAAAAGVAGLGAMALKAGAAADDLNTLSKQSGFSTDEIQKWDYASDRVDVDTDTIVKAAQKMKKNMVSTSKETTEAWETLGVSVRDTTTGELRDSTDVFYEVLSALSQVPNETERDVLAMQLFGKSADELAGIVDDGGAALQELGKEAADAGLILSQDALDGANAFNDGVDELKAKASGAFMSAGASLAENLLPALSDLVEWLSQVLQWVAGLDGDKLKVIGIILLIVAAISPLASAISGVATLISVITNTIIPGLSAAFGFLAANPIVAVIAVLAALAAGIVYLWKTNEDFREKIIKIWDKIKGFFTEMIPEFLKIGKDIVVGLWNGINDKVKWIQERILGFGETVLGTIKSFFGIKSPSKVFAGIGGYMAQGLGNGFVDQMKNVSKQIVQSVPTDFESDVSYAVSDPNDYVKGEEKSKIEHVVHGTVRIEGVNNQNEFVAASEVVIEEMLANIMKRQRRLA